MIKVVTGFSGPGGSTVAFNTLVNLFNKYEMESCLYGPSEWEGISCNFKSVEKLSIKKEDILIYHFLLLNIKCKKVILSCHETELFPILKLKNKMYYDAIHFVSQFQKDWQDVEGTVIPNPIREFSTRTNDNSNKVAGIIGSIDRNKRVELSIQKAIADGHTDIRLYGAITDNPYYYDMILPLLSDKVKYMGVASNMDYVYNQLTHVYHSPKLETFNLIKPECISAGVTYIGNEGNDTKAEYWSEEKIIERWKVLLA